METLIIEKVKSFLTSVLIPGSKATARTPAIAVYAPIDIKDFVHIDHDKHDVVSAYIIHDLVALNEDPSDSRVNVYFHFPFDEPAQQQKDYVVTLDIQELAVVNALGAMHDRLGGGLPIVVINSNLHNPNPNSVLDPSHISFAIVPPHPKSTEAIEFSAKMAELFNAGFSVPRSSRPWYEDAQEPNEVSPLLRDAQGRLLSILMGLTRGDVAYIKELIQFESELDNLANSSDDDDEDVIAENEFLSLLVHITTAVYNKATLCNPALQTVETVIENVGPIDYKPDVDVFFKKITSSSELIDIFKNIEKDFKIEKSEKEIIRDKNIKIWESNLESNWPTHMSKIGEYLATLDDYDTYVSLLHEDFSDVDRINERIAEIGLGKVFTALTLIIAVYALRRVNTLEDPESDFPAVLILNEWINLSDDEFVWELPALAESLSVYETKTAVDVLTMYYQPRKEPSQAFHLLALLHTLGHHFMEDPEWDDYDFTLLKEDLAALENNTPEFKEFSEWFLTFMDTLMESFAADENTGDSEACYSSTATRIAIETSEQIEKTAGFVALTLPVMADILAKQNSDLDEGGSDWAAFRCGYIQSVLISTAETFGRRIKLVAR